MTFEREKVVDGLCDNLEQWIGWKGYFSNYLADLKRDVENECKDNFSTFYEFEEDLVSCRLIAEKYSCNYQFFYPVEPPEKKKLVPFDTCQELIDWYCEREGLVLSENNLPSIWIKKKECYNNVLISGFIENRLVLIGGSIFSLRAIFVDYTLLDGTPMGKEVEK